MGTGTSSKGTVRERAESELKHFFIVTAYLFVVFGALTPRNVGSRAMDSARALIGLRPPSGSLQPCGISPQRSSSSVRSPVSWFSRIT